MSRVACTVNNGDHRLLRRLPGDYYAHPDLTKARPRIFDSKIRSVFVRLRWDDRSPMDYERVR